MTYTPFLSLLERAKKYDKVDKMLHKMMSEGLFVNHVVLGDLVNAAGSVGDWQRADRIWQMLIHEFKVKPNNISYTATCRKK